MRLLCLQNNATRYNKNSTKVSIQDTVPSVSTVPIGIENFGNSCHLSAVLVVCYSIRFQPLHANQNLGNVFIQCT